MIGVPFDVLFRARRHKSAEVADLEAMVDINVRRFTYMSDLAGPWLTGLLTFILSGLLLAGFGYGVELAQGLFILAAPLSVIIALNMMLAHELRDTPLHGGALVQKLFRLRIWTQAIGMIAIFLTALYGMYYNLVSLTFF